MTETFEAQQQAAEFILPAKYALNGVEPLLEDFFVEKWLVAALAGSPASGIGIDVRHHTAIENRLAVTPAIVDTIEADDRAAKIEFDEGSDPRHLRQRRMQEWRFVLIARRGYERCDHVAGTCMELFLSSAFLAYSCFSVRLGTCISVPTCQSQGRGAQRRCQFSLKSRLRPAGTPEFAGFFGGRIFLE